MSSPKMGMLSSSSSYIMLSVGSLWLSLNKKRKLPFPDHGIGFHFVDFFFSQFHLFGGRGSIPSVNPRDTGDEG